MDLKFGPCFEIGLFRGKAILKLGRFGNLEFYVTANYCKLPQPKGTIEFVADIGRTSQQSVEIINDSKKNWVLKPCTEGRFFTADKIVDIPSNNIGVCNVFYNPVESSDVVYMDKVSFFIMVIQVSIN